MAIAYGTSGNAEATASNGVELSPNCPPTVNANDILLAHVCYRNTSTTPSTPSGWELLAGPENAGTVTPTGRHWVFGRIADGTEDNTPVVFGTAGGTVLRHAQVYSFTGYVSGTITDVVVGFAHATGDTSTVDDVAVTTTVAGALACQMGYATDDNSIVNATNISMTGESGGDWISRGGWFTTTTGSDGLHFLQTAAMASVGTIDGGSVSISAADPWGCYGFEIRPNPPAATQVEQTVATTWDVAVVVEKTAATTWDTSAVVEKTVATTWDVAANATQVEKTVATGWDTSAIVEKTTASTWDTAAIVQKTVASTWDVRAVVEKTTVLTWDTTAVIQKTAATTWDTAAAVEQAVATTWDVFSTSGAQVEKTVATTWDTAAVVQNTTAVTWDLRTVVEQAIPNTWDVFTTIQKTTATTWDVDGPAQVKGTGPRAVSSTPTGRQAMSTRGRHTASTSIGRYTTTGRRT